MRDGKKKSKVSLRKLQVLSSDSSGFNPLFGSIAPKSISSPQGAPSMFETIGLHFYKVKQKCGTVGVTRDIK